MSTNAIIKRLPASRIQCTVTIDDAQAKQAEDKALTELSKHLKIEGFRPGKAPPAIARERINPQDLLEEMIRTLLPRIFQSLIKEHGIKPIIHPKVELTSRDPLTLTVTFVEYPEVKIKNADAITIEKKEPNISDKDVETMISYVLRQHAAKDGAVPLLTDAFAKSHLGCGSAEEFRRRVRESMMEQERAIEKRRREEALLEAIRKAATVELAPELIDDEERTLMEELGKALTKQKLSFEEYLKRTGKTQDEFAKDLKGRAEKRLHLRFAVRALVEEKQIQISDDEMTTIVTDFLAPLSPEERSKIEPLYAKGAENYEQLKWQKRVERKMEEMLK